MTNKQKEAWKKIRNAGTASLIIGCLEVGIYTLLLLLGVFLIILDTQVQTGDNSVDTVSSVVLGLILLCVALVLLSFSIVNIIAGIKLRKPVSNPKGWVVYLIVIGALRFTSLQGIIELIFGIIAYLSLSDIEESEPPLLRDLRN